MFYIFFELLIIFSDFKLCLVLGIIICSKLSENGLQKQCKCTQMYLCILPSLHSSKIEGTGSVIHNYDQFQNHRFTTYLNRCLCQLCRNWLNLEFFSPTDGQSEPMSLGEGSCLSFSSINKKSLCICGVPVRSCLPMMKESVSSRLKRTRARSGRR